MGKNWIMFSKKVEAALNEQIRLEGFSSNVYLSMAVWAEQQGFEGVANFMYKHADEAVSYTHLTLPTTPYV